jgi:hypothetical protein
MNECIIVTLEQVRYELRFLPLGDAMTFQFTNYSGIKSLFWIPSKLNELYPSIE